MLYYLSGTNMASLLACYELTGNTLEPLPENAEDFIAGERQDGLVTFRGTEGMWEATLELSPEQVERLQSLPGIEIDAVS
jgi:hypothetical protein